MCNKGRGPSLLLSALTAQLRRTTANTVSDLIGLEMEAHSFRTSSDVFTYCTNLPHSLSWAKSYGALFIILTCQQRSESNKGKLPIR